MIIKQGINSSRSTLSTKSNSLENLNSRLSELETFSIPVRVIDIVLNDSHPKFNEVGQYNGIGAVFFTGFNQNNTQIVSYALPYSSHIKTYPLVDEIILITSLPDQGKNSSSSSTRYFYHNPIGIWNTPNHNAFPFLSTTPSINSNYQSNIEGQVQQENNQLIKAQLNSPTNPSKDPFIEKSNIRSIQPQPGDTLIEGRNGQSIRFSNNNGDPITFIRNGQDKTIPSSGFEPVAESIRNDLSSIYLTSTQQLKDFKVAGNENYSAFPSSFQPIPPSLYSKPQIAINSDRIVINAQENSILLSAKKTLSISVENSVGITTPAFYVDSSKIRLGGNDAKEPILKGNITVSLLKSLVESVEKLAQILEVEKNWPQGALVTSNNTVATNAKTTLQDLLKQLDLDESKSDSLKSYTSKVK